MASICDFNVPKVKVKDIWKMIFIVSLVPFWAKPLSFILCLQLVKNIYFLLFYFTAQHFKILSAEIRLFRFNNNRLHSSLSQFPHFHFTQFPFSNFHSPLSIPLYSFLYFLVPLFLHSSLPLPISLSLQGLTRKPQGSFIPLAWL